MKKLEEHIAEDLNEEFGSSRHFGGGRSDDSDYSNRDYRGRSEGPTKFDNRLGLFKDLINAVSTETDSFVKLLDTDLGQELVGTIGRNRAKHIDEIIQDLLDDRNFNRWMNLYGDKRSNERSEYELRQILKNRLDFYDIKYLDDVIKKLMEMQ